MMAIEDIYDNFLANLTALNFPHQYDKLTTAYKIGG